MQSLNIFKLYIFLGLVSVDLWVLLHNLWVGGRGVNKVIKRLDGVFTLVKGETKRVGGV